MQWVLLYAQQATQMPYYGSGIHDLAAHLMCCLKNASSIGWPF
jgi:hypothetical protein